MTNPKIMVVEDDSFMLLFLTQLFEMHGYEVCPVYGHYAALSSAIDFLRKSFNKEDLLNRVKPLAMIGKMSKMLSSFSNKI